MPPAKCKLCKNSAVSAILLDENHLGFNLLEVIEDITQIHISGTAQAGSRICKPCADGLCLVNNKVNEYRRAFGINAQKSKITNKTNGRLPNEQSSSKTASKINGSCVSLENNDVTRTTDQSEDIRSIKVVPKNSPKKLSQPLIFPKETPKRNSLNVSNLNKSSARAHQSIDCNSDSDVNLENVSRLSFDTYLASTRLENEHVPEQPKEKEPNGKIRQRRKSVYHFTCEYCGLETNTIKGFQKHLTEEHDIKTPRIFECKPCGVKYTVKINLDLHNKKVHANENINQAVGSSVTASPKDTKPTLSDVITKTAKAAESNKKPNAKGHNRNKDASLEDKINTTVQTEESCQADKITAESKNLLPKKGRVKNIYKFCCEQCPYEGMVGKAFANHLIEVHGILKPRIFQCKFCSSSYCKHQTLKRHIESMHSQPTENADDEAAPDGDDNDDDDDYVNNSTAPADDIISHTSLVMAKITPLNVPAKEESVHKVDDFKCSICGFRTSKAKVYKKHLSELHESDETRIFACDKCPMKYQYNRNLKRHKEQKHGLNKPESVGKKEPENKQQDDQKPEKQRSQKVSPKKLKRNSDSDMNLQIFATPPVPKKQKRVSANLPENKSLSQSASLPTPSPVLTKHNNSHSLEETPLIKANSEERMTCSKCMKGFKNKEKLENHMDKRHRKQLLPICLSCNKTFNTPEKLARHKSRASCVKHLYRCEVSKCAKSFSDKVFLLSHMMNVHSMPDNYEDDTE